MQGFINGLDNNLCLVEDVVVPKAQNPKAFRPQKGIAASVIVRLLDMLAAIQFDDDARRKAGEITNIRADRVLSAKLEPS